MRRWTCKSVQYGQRRVRLFGAKSLDPFTERQVTVVREANTTLGIHAPRPSRKDVFKSPGSSDISDIPPLLLLGEEWKWQGHRLPRVR